MHQEGRYHIYFDYLRLVLASVVMLSHDGWISWHASGSLAVEVFFAMSGWLIGGILLKTNRDGLPKFYFNRAARIWVPYYLALGLVIAASLVKDPIDWKWLEFVLYKATWTYNLFGPGQLEAFHQSMPLDGTANHFWSVNTEEQFYLLAPLLLVVFPKTGRSPLTWVALAISTWTLQIGAAITFGVMAAVLANRYGDFYATVTARCVLAATLAVSIAGLVFDHQVQLYGPFFAIAAVLLLAKRGNQHAAGRLLGGMSYPLYLNHWIGVFVWNALLKPFQLDDTMLRKILSVATNYAIAAALFCYVEQPILALRDRVYTPARGVLFTYWAYGLVIAGLAIGAAAYFLNQ